MQAQRVLHNLIMDTCPDMHKTRRNALEATVQSALIGRRLTVTDLGRSMQSSTSHKHNISGQTDCYLTRISIGKAWRSVVFYVIK